MKWLPVTQTYSDEVGAVVVKNGFNFNLLSADCRVGQPQVNEEFLPNNDLQGLANTDSFKETKHEKGKGQKQRARCGLRQSSPCVLDRLIPVNCQVVIESCKGTFFTSAVVSL